MKKYQGLPSIFLLLAFLFVAGCNGSGDEGEGDADPPSDDGHELVDPYTESQDEGEGTETEGDTNHINIVFEPDKSELATPCERIELVQVIQMFADGTPIDPGDYYSGYAYRDPTALDDDPDTDENEDGTYVDHGKNESGIFTQPGYNAPGQGAGTTGSINGATSDSDITDAPLTGGGDKGFKSDANPDGWETVRYEFEVCAFCAKGEDCPHFFECITWVFEKTADDQANGRLGTSRITGQSNAPTDKFTKAFEKFNDDKNYEPCEDE